MMARQLVCVWRLTLVAFLRGAFGRFPKAPTHFHAGAGILSASASFSTGFSCAQVFALPLVVEACEHVYNQAKVSHFILSRKVCAYLMCVGVVVMWVC